MSVADIRGDLMSNLEQAFDIKKVFTVFDKLISVIKDQQEKLDIYDMKFTDLYQKMKTAQSGGGSPQQEARIKELEKKLNEVLLNLNGDGHVDSVVLGEVDAYKQFDNAGSFAAEFIPISKPNSSAEPRKPKSKTIAEVPAYVPPQASPPSKTSVTPAPAAAVTPSPARVPTPGAPLTAASDVFPAAPTENVDAQLEEEYVPDPRVPTPAPRNFTPAPYEISEEYEEEAPQQSDDQPRVQSPPRAITPGAPRAITPASPMRMNAAVVEPSRVAVEQRSITPDKPKVYLKAASFAQNLEESYNAPTFDPPELNTIEEAAAPAPPLSSRALTFTTAAPAKRRRMSLSNLKHLTPERHKLIVKLLKRKGMFLHIARVFQLDARKKYTEVSLKHRVDVLEADVKKILAKIDNIKLAVRKNHLAIKELLPPGFAEVYASIIELMGIINACGGTTVLIQKLTTDPAAGLHDAVNHINDRLKSAMFFDAKGDPPHKLLEIIMSQMRSTVLQDYEMATSSELNKIKSRLLEFGSHIVSKDDILNMLSLQATNGTNSEYHENSQNNVGSNNDPMHMKLIKLIQSLIDKNNGKLDMLNENKSYNTLQLNTNSEISAAKLEEISNANKKYTDDRVHILKNAIKAVAIDTDSKVDRYGQDLSDIQKKLMSITGQFNDSLQIQQEHIETFNKETAALKILQRKVNNMGMEKLMEDLKRVHTELLERPSAAQVGEMMDLVENTIKSNLGENIVGLKGLVEQVYKHIQHKVDRDDIKGLITVKLAQMEADLLRREEEVYSMTSTTRCLSCGQVPINPLRKQVASNILNTHGNTRLPTENSVYDDESSQQSSLVAHMLSQSAPQLTVSRNVPSEQIVPLVTGNVGLKSLLPQHLPQQAVNPYTASTKRKTGEHIPEPLYRKAKMAAQMKEMVKVSTPATSMYGYGPNNPMYVMDGLLDDDSVASMASENKLKGSKRVGTTGGGLHFNNMNASGIQQKSKIGGTGEYVQLPQINTGAPPGFLNGKPLSPSEHALAADYGGPQPITGQSAKLNSYY